MQLDSPPPPDYYFDWRIVVVGGGGGGSSWPADYGTPRWGVYHLCSSLSDSSECFGAALRSHCLFNKLPLLLGHAGRNAAVNLNVRKVACM